MELKCKVQHYEWGKVGSESMVAQLVKSGDPSAVIEEGTPYAELWLGTHPSGPSLLPERGVLLADYLRDNEDAVGPLVKRKYGVQVPFLMKVLSIRKALSIQAHPDKKLAERLHQQFPQVYKDANHKPELAVALTPFEVLCGFRPLAQIQDFLNNVPELRGLLPAGSVAALGEGEATVRPVFEALLKADRAAVAHSLDTFLQRLEKEGAGGEGEGEVVRRLVAQHGPEAGCWAPLLLNHWTLRPGEAIYLKPNLPHAYLAGDCIEVMANSDNVVRAGLTPKPVDLPTLVSMLDYTPYAPGDLLLPPSPLDAHCTQWAPPLEDFKLWKIEVEAGSTYNSMAAASPGVALVTGGGGTVCDTEGVAARPGTALFLKASRQLTLHPGAHGMHLYLATANLDPSIAHNGLF